MYTCRYIQRPKVLPWNEAPELYLRKDLEGMMYSSGGPHLFCALSKRFRSAFDIRLFPPPPPPPPPPSLLLALLLEGPSPELLALTTIFIRFCFDPLPPFCPAFFSA